MANPHRGEVPLHVDGRDYVLRFSVNALCELEEATGQGVNAIAEQITDAARTRLGLVRSLFWAALRDHHPDVTMAQAGEILSDAGVPNVMAKVGHAFALAFPADEGGAKSANGAHPRRAGGGSKSSPAIPKQG